MSSIPTGRPPFDVATHVVDLTPATIAAIGEAVARAMLERDVVLAYRGKPMQTFPSKPTEGFVCDPSGPSPIQLATTDGEYLAAALTVERAELDALREVAALAREHTVRDSTLWHALARLDEVTKR